MEHSFCLCISMLILQLFEFTFCFKHILNYNIIFLVYDKKRRRLTAIPMYIMQFQWLNYWREKKIFCSSSQRVKKKIEFTNKPKKKIKICLLSSRDIIVLCLLYIKCKFIPLLIYIIFINKNNLSIKLIKMYKRKNKKKKSRVSVSRSLTFQVWDMK